MPRLRRDIPALAFASRRLLLARVSIQRRTYPACGSAEAHARYLRLCRLRRLVRALPVAGADVLLLDVPLFHAKDPACRSVLGKGHERGPVLALAREYAAEWLRGHSLRYEP